MGYAIIESMPDISGFSDTWILVIRDARDAFADEPLSFAGFETAQSLRQFLSNYMDNYGDDVLEYWIYQNGNEHEYVTQD